VLTAAPGSRSRAEVRPVGDRDGPSRVERVAITAPDETTRWRCARCGNLTRFDVVRSTRARQFWHFDLGGAVTIEDQEAMRDEIETVTCRWCGAADTIELIARARR